MKAQRGSSSNYNRGRFQGKGQYFSGARQQQVNQNSLIEFGSRGYFITVEGRQNEKGGVREAYNLFDSIEDNSTSLNKPSNSSLPDNSEIDASDELAAACAEILDSKKPMSSSAQHRLRQIPTGVNNCLFFRVQNEVPIREIYATADRIVEKCQASSNCRFVARLLPVEIASGTNLTHLSSDLEQIIRFHFVENWKEKMAPPTYSLEFKARNNHSIHQKDVLSILDNLLQQIAPSCRVNLTSPDLSILVNVLQKNVLLSCVRDYHGRRKLSTRPPQEKTPEMPAPAVDHPKGDQEKSDDEPVAP